MQPVAPQPTLQPLHEIPLKQWRNHPDLQARLRFLMADPVFIMACQTVMRAAFPGVEPAAKAEPGVSAEATNNAMSQRYAHRSGVGYFPKLLKFLVCDKATPLPASGYGQMLLEESE